jgi:hypothetical protein
MFNFGRRYTKCKTKFPDWGHTILGLPKLQFNIVPFWITYWGQCLVHCWNPLWTTVSWCCAKLPTIKLPYLLIFVLLTIFFIFRNRKTLERSFLTFLAWYCSSLGLEHYKHCESYVVCPQEWLDTLSHSWIDDWGPKGLNIFSWCVVTSETLTPLESWCSTHSVITKVFLSTS